MPTRDRGLAMADLADRDWIVNSRHIADERALRSLAARAGFAPRVVHRIDSLELVDDLVSRVAASACCRAGARRVAG